MKRRILRKQTNLKMPWKFSTNERRVRRERESMCGCVCVCVRERERRGRGKTVTER